MHNLLKKEIRGKHTYVILPNGEEIRMSVRYKTKTKQEKYIKEVLKQFLSIEEEPYINRQKKKKYTEIPFRTDKKTIIYYPEPECYINHELIYQVGGMNNMINKINQYKLIKYGNKKSG